MTTINVSEGESILSIARSSGFFWETVWNHGSNASLKAERRNPNQLRAGDEVFVPEITLKHVDKATDARHAFKRKGDPVKYRLRLLRFGEPRAGVDYVLEAGGQRIEGTTDGDGKLEHFLPGNATSGRLHLDGGREVYPIRINRLDPADSISGAQQRLQNLGFPLRRVTGELDAPTRAALARFQAAQSLPETGDLDAATVGVLVSKHP